MFDFPRASREFRSHLKQSKASLTRIALSWSNDPSLADDLAQEAITRALKKHFQLKDINKFECWIFSILNNCWREHLRRIKPTADIDELVLYSEKNTENEIEKLQIVDRVRTAIEKLPIGQRQVITLVDLQEFSYAEVAETLDIPTGTVMSRLNRARKNLKQNLVSLHNELSSQNSQLRAVK